MAFTASLLGARHLGNVVENKPASLLVVSLSKALNGTPHLYVVAGGPDTSEMATPRRVRTFRPKYRVGRKSPTKIFKTILVI